MKIGDGKHRGVQKGADVKMNRCFVSNYSPIFLRYLWWAWSMILCMLLSYDMMPDYTTSGRRRCNPSLEDSMNVFSSDMI